MCVFAHSLVFTMCHACRLSLSTRLVNSAYRIGAFRWTMAQQKLCHLCNFVDSVCPPVQCGHAIFPITKTAKHTTHHPFGEWDLVNYPAYHPLVPPDICVSKVRRKCAILWAHKNDINWFLASYPSLCLCLSKIKLGLIFFIHIEKR